MHISELSTPALVADLPVMESNIATMSAIHPGSRLRPHVKAHKTTSIAARQVAAGHHTFTCATPREVVGMARAGVGADLLLANETLDPARVRAMADVQDLATITVAVDSELTVDIAAANGIRNVLIDVNVGLPRCGIAPENAGALADYARKKNLEVRGVMGYEGHLMMVKDRDDKRRKVHDAMALLASAHEQVGGSIVSAGGTGTFDMFDGTTVNEVQAGSYVLMDSQYSTLPQSPFAQALWVVGTVISANAQWAVVDVGLKSLGMDHGNPSVENGSVLFVSDEHTTFVAAEGATLPKIGERIKVTPAHIDPTMALHSVVQVCKNDNIVDCWEIDLRGW